MSVELLLLHEHICSVTQIEISHDDAHPAEGLEQLLEAGAGSCSRRLLLLQALHVRGHMAAVTVVAEDVEDDEDHGRAEEEEG